MLQVESVDAAVHHMTERLLCRQIRAAWNRINSDRPHITLDKGRKLNIVHVLNQFCSYLCFYISKNFTLLIFKESRKPHASLMQQKGEENDQDNRNEKNAIIVLLCLMCGFSFA